MFWSIFSKAPNKSVFLIMFTIKNEGSYNIKFTLLNHFIMLYKKIGFFIAVSTVLIGFWTCQCDFEDKKKDKTNPCLGSFLAIVQQSHIKPI